MMLDDWISICKKKKKMRLDPYLTPYTEINSKQIRLNHKS